VRKKGTHYGEGVVSGDYLFYVFFFFSSVFARYLFPARSISRFVTPAIPFPFSPRLILSLHARVSKIFRISISPALEKVVRK